MTVRNFTYKFVEMLNNIDIDNFLSFIQNNINFAEITLLSAFIIGKHPDSHLFLFLFRYQRWL
jgi:predicted component of type VI protein secretion system